MKDKEIAFDTDRYLRYQTAGFKEFMKRSSDILYIEFGGKIINDKHSARVLPGYRENAKFELINKLCKNAEPIFVVSAKDILKGRLRGDFNITYDNEAIRKIDALNAMGLRVRHLALTMVPSLRDISKPLQVFSQKLTKCGVRTYFFPVLQKYSKGSFNLQSLQSTPFINVKKKVVMIISPGGGSGKFGVCLSQLFHQLEHGKSPRYLKFETFPVHDLPIFHPLNLAYMAASADFHDIVCKDKRNKKSSSYVRDQENYEMLHKLAHAFGNRGKHLKKISSATNMGINKLSTGIMNDDLIQKEAAAEIARRLMRYKFEVANGKEIPATLARVRQIVRML